MSNLISGAEILMRSLIDQGVKDIFGYPGGTIMPVYDKLYDFTDRINHYLARHEQGAIHAAEGFARVTGKTGVVFATSGPGAMNLLTGLNDALIDSTPIVAITGQVATAFLGKDAFQESDIVSVTLPVTKWTIQVRKAEDIAFAIAKAFYIANSGRPGPVVVDLTKDAQTGLAEYKLQTCSSIRSYHPNPEIKDSVILEAAELINKAERPMILAGHGIAIANAENLLLKLAEKAQIPVGCTMLGLSSIPSDHPLYKGMLGMHGNIGANINTNKSDVILALGMRFDDRVTGDVKKYAPDAKIIHIDIDASEFDKCVKSDVHVHGCVRQALEKLIPFINEAEHGEWLESFTPHEYAEQTKVTDREVNAFTPNGKMLMGEVISKVSKAFGDDAVLVTDVGQNQMFAVKYFNFKSPRSIVTSGGLGTMGFGLPSSIGAKIGAPDRNVVLFVGDGGFQMTIEELGMVMEYNLGVKIVLLNNNFLGNVRQWQHLFFNGRFSATPMINPDFRMIADAYGIPAEDVANRDELDNAIKRMAEHTGAYLLNINIEPTDMVFPMTPPGSGVDEILVAENEYYKPATN
ncbi:MAG: biosynthetic-type acetolactate synthase large subunit [Muribaculaceae bacterium]|nr:biosynthetic-type acetolactate synthase large subunit [Muribaculaceae bacterium]